jgi:hypothetical protein
MYAKEKANEGEREGESCWRCGEKGREGWGEKRGHVTAMKGSRLGPKCPDIRPSIPPPTATLLSPLKSTAKVRGPPSSQRCQETADGLCHVREAKGVAEEREGRRSEGKRRETRVRGKEGYCRRVGWRRGWVAGWGLKLSGWKLWDRKEWERPVARGMKKFRK